jgi:general secretion pathway protein I
MVWWSRPIRMNRPHQSKAFTLVEVLVALAVVSLVLVALLGSMQAVVASATLIHDRTIASWIAVDKITEYRLGSDFPGGKRDSGELEMADVQWVYNATFEQVSVLGDILTVIVKVATIDEPEITLGIASGTLVRPATAGGPPPGVLSGSGGPPPGVLSSGSAGSRVRLNGIAPATGGGFGPSGSGNFGSTVGDGLADSSQNSTTEGEAQ